MDPIHPLTPRPPAIPPITGGRGPNPSERKARDRREQRRREQDEAERDGREPGRHEPARAGQSQAETPGEDDGPHHIDVRA